MTSDELNQLRAMSTSRIRRNYWMCESQLDTCRQEPGHRLDKATRKLCAWQMSYLDELVRRGERI